MRPNFSFYNTMNMSNRNFILISKLFNTTISMWGVRLSYFKNILIGKFGSTNILSLKFYKSIFSVSIVSIVFISSQKKMFRINASRVIAFVAYQKVVRNFTKSYFPHIARRYNNFIKSVYSYMKITIAMMFSSKPIPTVVNSFLVNFSPKSFEFIIQKYLNSIGISISFDSIVVHRTISMCMRRFNAVFNRTYFHNSNIH